MKHCTVLDDGNKRKVSQKFVLTTKVGTIIITNSLPLIHRLLVKTVVYHDLKGEEKNSTQIRFHGVKQQLYM